jgi:carbamoyl-phosphate synthase small subunit
MGSEVRLLSANSKAEEILLAAKDGLLLSNGPGDPSAATHVLQELKKVIGRIPVFSICLGHQLLALALGARTYKMKFGHRGMHHPVVQLDSSGRALRTWITSQNHGFAVDQDSFEPRMKLTFVHADDQSVEGFELRDLRCHSVQFHPEAAPGPWDASQLLQDFVHQLIQQKERERGSGARA